MCQARADETGAFGLGERGGGGHAWLLVERPDGSTRLVHLPPTRGANAAPVGTVRLGIDLAERPDAIAAFGDRVAFLFSPDDEQPGKVAQSRIVPTPGGTWAMLPDGRLDTVAAIQAGARIGSIALDAEGPLLFARPGDVLAAWRLGDGGTLVPIDVGPIGDGAWRVAVSGAGAALAAEAESGWALWRLEQSGWAQAGSFAGALPDVVFDLGALVVAGDRVGDRVRLRSLGRTGVVELGAWSGEPGSLVVGAQDDGNAGVVLVLESAHEGDGADPGVASRTFQLSVIDAGGGVSLFTGPPRPQQVVSPAEFRLLVVLLLLVMGVALLVAVRPDPNDGVIVLPAGWALAEPGRRVAATLMDYILAAFVASLLTRTSLLDVLTGLAMLRGGDAWAAIPLALVIATALGVVGEWVTGRSVGKLVMSCRVVRVGPTIREDWSRVGGFGAIARNVVKWWLPPVAVLGLLDQQGRHRGDGLGRTAVVIPIGLGEDEAD